MMLDFLRNNRTLVKRVVQNIAMRISGVFVEFYGTYLVVMRSILAL